MTIHTIKKRPSRVSSQFNFLRTAQRSKRAAGSMATKLLFAEVIPVNGIKTKTRLAAQNNAEKPFPIYNRAT